MHKRFIYFSLLTCGRACSRSAMFKQAYHCSRSIAAFTLSLFTFFLVSCDSGDIEEQALSTTDKGKTVKLRAVLFGINSWENKYAVSLAGFTIGDNYAQVVRTIPNTTPDSTRVELVLSNIGEDINTVELAITNRLRERIITIAKVNLDDYVNQKDTIHMDLGLTDISRFGALQKGLFNMACIQCHGGNGGAGAASLNLTEGRSFANLVNMPSTRKEGTVRVVSGNAQESLIHQIMAEGGENLLHVNHTEILSNQFRENLNEVRLLIDEWINNLE
ncbi:MAG: hypothetical protein IKO73_00585 [Bacteroidaceae bacterium]|nr:hypothetical protein [Bacteroidaceae bacterium]